MGFLDRFRNRAPEPAQPEIHHTSVTWEDFHVPVQVITEYRANCRVAFAKEKAIMRLSSLLLPDARQQQEAAFQEWIIRQIRSHPDRYQRFLRRVYHHGQTLQVGRRTYIIQLQAEAGRRTLTGKLYPDTAVIHFQVPAGVSDEKLAPHIESLLSRIIGAHHLPEVTRRVHELNQRHFRQPLGTISLKYNHSNWGSCSSRGNINLSTRLLFAPPEVLDYVIIHELAHRLEMNHSPRFWALVAAAMPHYRAQEDWLRTHGAGMSY